MTDWGEPLTPANPAAPAPRKCPHPRHLRLRQENGDQVCGRAGCGHVITAAAARRGRNNNYRGNRIERKTAPQLGLTRVGQRKGPIDHGESTEPFAVQVKSGGMFSERYWRELQTVKRHMTANQTALLLVADSHQGSARRAMVVLDIADWIALHGLSGVAEVKEP